MTTSSWENPVDPFRPVSNGTSLAMPQPSSEHSFPPYVVICVYTVLWCSKHKLRGVSQPPSHSCNEESIRERPKVCLSITLTSALVYVPCCSHNAWLLVGI